MLSQYLSSCTRIERVEQEIYPHLIIIREGFTLIKCSYATPYFPSFPVRLSVNRIWGFMMYSSNLEGTFCFFVCFVVVRVCLLFSKTPNICLCFFSSIIFLSLIFPNIQPRRKYFAKYSRRCIFAMSCYAKIFTICTQKDLQFIVR